ncbi:MAG: D-lactate dehydrogenase [Pseudomonadota bacterium]|jgi:D-lactate dehydrogenase
MSHLIDDLSQCLPLERIITDPVRRLAYGTDASFYRLTPEVVVIAESETEIRHLMALAHRHEQSLTFRAAGTSLSGQAVTDGILVLLGDAWRSMTLSADGHHARLGPGVVGAEANRRLAPFSRKIGPDPASINTCKIGGIAANNASGMCCGTAQNTYRTLAGLRIMLADGTILDSEAPSSRQSFQETHRKLLQQLQAMGERVRADEALSERIRRKFSIKNTTGYSLNALVDYEDPIDILIHLMIGSEGTLGFLSQISYHTVEEHACKASALVLFADMETACKTVRQLKSTPVSAVEIMDRPALRSVENQPGLPIALQGLPDGTTALLIETRARNPATLTSQISMIEAVLSAFPLASAAAFQRDSKDCEALWKVRKGMFPSVGAMRPVGTTVIIEDVAFPLDSLAAGTLDLQALFLKHGYHEAIIFGHALEGNLHFVFTQDFSSPEEVARYAAFMDDVCDLVVKKYDGSLKAEHGTGRNMAPFVELEWGQAATELMWKIKRLLDPAGILNPGVILNKDKQVHLQNLKPMPAIEGTAGDLVNRCIECGFCEPQCPSAGLTFSPRQRIVISRDLAHKPIGPTRYTEEHTYRYYGMDTCAGCGLCSTVCPIGIDTGALIREQRAEQASTVARYLGKQAANHFAATAALARHSLTAGKITSKILGNSFVQAFSAQAWKKGLTATKVNAPKTAQASMQDEVVYFSGCAGRIFGESNGDDLPTVITRVMNKAGLGVRLPKEQEGLCCGQPFFSKGLFDSADQKAQELAEAILDACEGGRLPVVFDASPCTLRMRQYLQTKNIPLSVLDFGEFAHDTLLDRLTLTPQSSPIALHLNCSAKRLDEGDKLQAIAQACAYTVISPATVKCCGFGGDRGFAVPELNKHALRDLKTELPVDCTHGYSSNRTCEIGLTENTGIPYRSIAYLLDACSNG